MQAFPIDRSRFSLRDRQLLKEKNLLTGFRFSENGWSAEASQGETGRRRGGRRADGTSVYTPGVNRVLVPQTAGAPGMDNPLANFRSPAHLD
jgi:hypothetical protein